MTHPHRINTPAEIKAYLEKHQGPITDKEFQEFWNSLSRKDQDHYRYMFLGEIPEGVDRGAYWG